MPWCCSRWWCFFCTTTRPAFCTDHQAVSWEMQLCPCNWSFYRFQGSCFLFFLLVLSREWMGLGVAMIINSHYGSFPKIPCVKRTSKCFFLFSPCKNPRFSATIWGLGGLPEYFGGRHGSDPASLADPAIFCGDSAGGTQRHDGHDVPVGWTKSQKTIRTFLDTYII